MTGTDAMLGRRRTLCFLLLLVANLSIFAVSATFAADLKIVYVDVVRVIEDAPQGKIALRKLEAEFKPRYDERVEIQNKIKQMEDELEKDTLALKASERRAKERELLALKRNLRRATQEFREDYNLRRNEELASLQKTVYKAIVAIAKKNNYDLVLHEGTVYASKKIDITELVLEHLGKK